MHSMGRRLNEEAATRLGERLGEARRERYGTLQGLAAHCGVSHTQISRIERGRFKTVSGNVRKMCNVLGVSAPGLSGSVAADAVVDKVLRIAGKSPRTMRFISQVL